MDDALNLLVLAGLLIAVIVAMIILTSRGR